MVGARGSCAGFSTPLYFRFMNEQGVNVKPPRVSVVIPSRDGYREGRVPRLLESIEAQTYRDYEVIVVKGVFPQGKAINQGAEQARGDILVVLDDDSRLADETVIETLVAVLDADPSIGMAGSSIAVPPEARKFQQRAARQFPRFNTPVVNAVTDSDFACHGCCAFPISAFNAVGRERIDLIRGLDPDLRERLRAYGYRVVLAPNVRTYHPLPDGWGPLLRVFFRNGFGSAHTRKFKPAQVFETHECLDMSTFRPRSSLLYRACRFPLRLLKALLQARFIRFAAYSAYACGYLWGMLTAEKSALERG
jgi:glycosyltransferase involved in cell wall biosynthesis